MELKNKLLVSFVCIGSPLSALSYCQEDLNAFNPHFKLRADLICWVPETEGLDANFGKGSSQNTTSGGITTITSTETDIDPHFEWSAGYRIAMGWLFDKNPWEIGALWTDFHGRAKEPMNHGTWNVRLYQLDLATFYNGCVSGVHLQPFIGVRGTSIFQKIFSAVITPIVYATGTATDTRRFDDQEQFYGLGPTTGLNADFPLKHGFSLYGNLGFSLLYGTYHLRFDDTEVLTSPATPSQIFSTLKKNMKAFDFNLDLALGARWEYLIHDQCNLCLLFGLENHQYFNQSRMGHTFGNLSFSGAVFSLGFAL